MGDRATPAHERVTGRGMPAAGATRYYRRFDRVSRVTHGVLMLSFLGLAATGMPLLFSDQRWAWGLSRVFGGFEASGVLHRFFATLLIGVFVAHIGRLVLRVYRDKDYSIFWGPTSLAPQPRDLRDMVQHFRWFIGRGPRPTFDRYTYWEKFDYWAVFWGMFIIGGSGLMLWFPGFFSVFLPGWVFNIALLVHGEEALLAVGFIFTIHFFNGHLRPTKFPMDLVIFTGRVTEDELQHERPGEYARLARSGRLEALAADAPSPGLITLGRVIGTTAVVVGLTLVTLIVYAVVF